MKLADMTVKDYLDLLKSDAPAPGGGSVSALTAAQGIGLVGMVAARSKAIADATLKATEVPFETLTLCLEGLNVTAKLVGKSNPNAASDLGVAALNLLAGIKGAWLNVLINLPGVKDEAAKAGFEAGAAMVAEAEKLAAEIYESVKASL